MLKLLTKLWAALNGVERGVYECCEHCDTHHPVGTHRDAPCLHKGCVNGGRLAEPDLAV